MAGWRDVEVSQPWGSLVARARGPPAGQPCLLLHGWLDNAGTWSALAPLLPPHLHLVALELPGHGLSDHLPAGLHYHDVDHLSAIR